MKINEATKETGLTKKAIYYYEEVGLIAPQKNAENNYRIYTKDDIEKLISIRTLRELDFSMNDIQHILAKDNFAQAMHKQVDFLNGEIERLKKSKIALEQFIQKGKTMDVNSLKQLAQQLEDEAKNLPNYMQKELDRILPGNLGKIFAIHYGQFLDEPLDTKEKENAWHDLVAFLDAQEDIQYPDTIKTLVDEMYGNYSDQELLKLGEKTKAVTSKVLAGTTTVSDATKNEVKTKIAEYEKSPQYQKFVSFQKFTADTLAPIFKEVDTYMCILSSRYAKFNTMLHDAADTTIGR